MSSLEKENKRLKKLCDKQAKELKELRDEKTRHQERAEQIMKHDLEYVYFVESFAGITDCPSDCVYCKDESEED